MADDDRSPADNRARKLAGRAKRRRFVQGTRAFTHAMTNRIAKRQGKRSEEPERRDGRGPRS